MARTSLILLLSGALLGSSGGCAIGMLRSRGPYQGLRSAQDVDHPESTAYRVRTTLGLVGDTLLIPVLGVGLIAWAIDGAYLWGVGGGYAERYYRRFPDRRYEFAGRLDSTGRDARRTARQAERSRDNHRPRSRRRAKDRQPTSPRAAPAVVTARGFSRRHEQMEVLPLLEPYRPTSLR